MSGDAREQVAAFVLRTSDALRPLGTRCFFYALFHEGERGREPVTLDSICASLASLEKMAPEAIEKRAQAIADNFVSQAQVATDASDSRRPQLFVVCAAVSSAEDAVPKDSWLLRVEPNRKVEAGFTDTEGATPQGMQLMAMRWLEINNKALERAMADARTDMQRSSDRMERILETMLRRNEYLENQQLQLMTQYQDALDRRAEREINAYAKKIEVDRTERWWQIAESEAPRIISKLMDRWGMGPFGQFVRMFKAEELRSFIGLLPPDKRAALLEALDVHFNMRMLQEAPANGVAAPTEARDPVKAS